MRKLILTRGAPGSGKSTILRQAGLGPFTLSMDVIRLLHSAPVMNIDGQMMVDQSKNPLVAEQLKKLIRARMERGELVAADNTMPLQKDFDAFYEMAKELRYEVAVVDLSTMPVEEAHRRNQSRHAHEQVPARAVERNHGQANQYPVDFKDARVFSWDPSETLAEQLTQWLEVPLVDFSHYRKVVHIGDLQGCCDVLIGPGGPLEFGFEDDVAYVFAGDFVDRGLENGRLIKWLVENAVHRSNVYFMWGNHEDHLDRWSKDLPAVSVEFKERTLPQLEAAGVTKADAKAICDKALEVLPYVWNGQKVIVTHAGLANVPARFEAISLFQYSHGTGQWEDPVDAQFERNSDPSWIQVHGHRNHGGVEVQASPRSFNLEDDVEFGGHLRTVTLDAQGWTPATYRNEIFMAWRDRPVRPLKKGVVLPLSKQRPSWMDRDNETRMDDHVLASMTQHSGVRQRTSQRAPHVVSLNFTKDVFFDASWDDVLVKARGLFINKTTQEVVARGYEKFFNVGERPDTQMAALKQSLVFPVAAYVKENGYLGNLGYDAETQSLFVASKATPDGMFADWFREIFEATVAPAQQERIRRWLRDNEASMVFEVIDPVRDPHMIDYDRAKLVLLDIFHRSSTPEKLDYDHLQAVGESFGLEVKRRAMLLPTPQALEGWHAKVTSDLSWRYQGREDIEGVVIEDAAGYQTKVKLPHYAFWKRMRSAKERLAKVLVRKEALDLSEEQRLMGEEKRLLGEIADQKAIVKGHKGQGPDAEAAKIQQRLLAPELKKVTQALYNRERLEDVLAEIDGIVARDPHPLAEAFLTWAAQQPAERIRDDSILQLRSRFSEEVSPDPALWQVPWVAFADGNEEELEAPTPRTGPKP